MQRLVIHISLEPVFPDIEYVHMIDNDTAYCFAKMVVVVCGKDDTVQCFFILYYKEIIDNYERYESFPHMKLF